MRTIETKVTAAGAGALVAALVVTLLRHVLGGDVPPAVVDAVNVLVPAAVAFAAGWLARHTPRPPNGA